MSGTWSTSWGTSWGSSWNTKTIQDAWGTSFRNAWSRSWGHNPSGVNSLARWVIPNPVLHNKEQAIVQKAINVKIDAIKKVVTKLPTVVSLEERKTLLRRLAELEQALDRLIDLFEFNAQQIIKKKIQEEEDEVIMIVLGEL